MVDDAQELPALADGSGGGSGAEGAEEGGMPALLADPSSKKLDGARRVAREKPANKKWKQTELAAK